MEIDGLKFEKPNGKRGLFNSPAAFSGTKTLGKIKTVVFLIELKEGTHTVSFIPERSAYLESLTAGKLPNPERLEFYPETKAEGYNGGGNPRYFDEVYRIYREGITLRGIKLWFLLGFIFLSAFAVAHDLYSKQGEFFITRESLGGRNEFQFSINVLSGFRLVKYPVSKYFSGGGNFLAFYEPNVEVRDLGFRPSGIKVIAVIGRNISNRNITKILEHDGRGFKLRRNIDEFGSDCLTNYNLVPLGML